MAPAVQSFVPSAPPAKDIDSQADPAVDRAKANELREQEFVDKMGAPDVHIDSETATCWYHWVGDLWVKPLRFENRSGTFVIVLKTDSGAELGKHRHRGEVRAYTVRGHWGYHEHEWDAKAGDYIVENPGIVHTPWMGEQSEILLNVMGSMEMLNDDGTLREIMDLFSIWRMYVEHCEKNGMKPNEKLWY